MHKKLIPFLIAFLLVFASITPAFAITGGQEDGNGHPYGALLLVPGYTFCSGTLIAKDVVLTAGHCTSMWEDPANEITEVWVTFDPYASVNKETWEITGGTWYRSTMWKTHPGYVDADWPFTFDYGLVFLNKPVKGITPAALPVPNIVETLIGSTGQTDVRFSDVGYGQDGVSFEQKPYIRNYDFIRKYSIQFFNPSVGTVGTQDPRWLILQNVPTDKFGGGCGGDSGSGIYPSKGELRNTVVAVHTGGYRMGYQGRLCGRMTSLNHWVDIPAVLDWIAGNLD